MKKADNNSPRGLERQKIYLQQKLDFGDNANDNSFFITEKVMESMRDSGYRDIRKAINDLIDNSEQANAKKIAVISTTIKEDIKNAKEKVCDIAVIDDGHGMFPDMLVDAVKWGGTDRHNQRDGLGRFGFGLPTAAISVTRTYEVYSKVKGGRWYKIRVSLNDITRGAIASGGNGSFMPQYEQGELPLFIQKYIMQQWGKNDLESGTVVLLKNADRIRSYSLPQTFQAKMLQNVGLTYRHYMPKVTFLVNDKKVGMIDPLFLNPNSIGYDAGNGLLAEGMPDMVIRVKNKLADQPNVEGDIRLRFSFRHPKFQRDKENSLINSRWLPMKQNNGYFIVCRSGRQIDVVKEPNYPSESDNTTLQNYDAQWAIELDFEPMLDELFGISTNKQQVEIDTYLWEIFKEHGIPAMITGFRKRDEELREKIKEDKKQQEAGPKESEIIMKDADRFEKTEIPEEKQKEADEKLIQEAEEIAAEQEKDVEEVKQELTEDAEKNKFKVEFTNYPGAPFYVPDLFGPQFKIKINTAHRFYKDIYSQQDARGQTAIELLLFALGKSEIESTEDMQMFYNQERMEWSRRLDLRLRILDKNNPLMDKEASKEEKLLTLL